MISGTILYPNGQTEPVSIPLDVEGFLRVTQQAVGGYIEIVRTIDNQTLIVNEEGWVRNLPPNAAASRHYRGPGIVGNAIFIDMKKEDLP